MPRPRQRWPLLLGGFALLAVVGGTLSLRRDEAVDRATAEAQELDAPGAAAAPGADRILFWMGCDQVAEMDDADLDLWRERGVDGFVCQAQGLPGLGGTNAFDPDPAAPLDDDAHGLQRRLRDSRIGERAAARGMALHLGFYVTNVDNLQTPLAEWFDDRQWNEVVLPRIRDLAASARALGFAGVAIDAELYRQRGDVLEASWTVDYPGVAHAADEVRAQVRRRGAEIMAALTEGFPDVDVVIYALPFPGGWEDEVQRRVNDIDGAFDNTVQVDLLQGLASEDGFAAIRILNAVFYKVQHVRGASWDEALRHDAAAFFALLSQRLPNWADVADRIHTSPFVWIGEGASDFERARSPDHVAEQLEAFSRWATGGTFANFVNGDIDDFDFEPYVDALQAASSPRVVATHVPTLDVDEPSVEDGAVVLAGGADDDFAVRVVRWRSGGASGAARLELAPSDGAPARVRWETGPIELRPGANTIELEVESIHGVTATAVVTVDA